MKTEIVSIFICPTKGDEDGAHHRMVALEYVEALTGLGLAGDRYALGVGAYSKNNPEKRQVSFIAIEAIEESNKLLEAPFEPKETRRNIVLKGIDVNSLVGKTFQIGSVIFEGTELCDPCHRPSKLVDKPGFKDAYDNRGGLRARVIKGGMVTVGEMTLKVLN